MKRTVDRDIGLRAYEEIRKRSKERGICAEVERIGISKRTVYAWASFDHVPSVFALQALCLAGYDVCYILTGRKRTALE